MMTCMPHFCLIYKSLSIFYANSFFWGQFVDFLKDERKTFYYKDERFWGVKKGEKHG